MTRDDDSTGARHSPAATGPPGAGARTSETLRALLDDVAAGRTGVEAAAAELARYELTGVGDYARLDAGRARRTGVPEIVYASGKTVEQFAAIVTAYLTSATSVLGSRVSPEQAAAVAAPPDGETVYDERSATLVVRRGDHRPPPPVGAVGVLAAGTSDVGVAEEAAVVCREMGVEALTAYDVGVAGVHRLVGPVRAMLEAGVAALVVAAGMEGALPSVVSGLVDVPVIGLPVSTGYGLGGRGEAALLGMLQSCAPGLVVVNIDNGVGAGVTAALIARRTSS
ncbi:MAG TPA: nickel pincer cofactor biosynthesis protein LarB [Thermoleophilia bacterium]|nr:nickel pincer cofactor biosynthesis protein LarB [Thermoleophilia bacterium]